MTTRESQLRARRGAPAVAAVVALGLGCNQADPDDDAGAPRAGTSGETDSGPAGMAGSDADSGAAGDDFYPQADGASWTYRHMGGSRTWDELVEQSATTYMDEPAVLLVDNPGPSGTHSNTVIATQGTRVLRVFREEFMGTTLQLTAVYDPGFLRYDRAWEDQEAGYSEVVAYQRTETDPNGVVTADSERSHRFTVESLDDEVIVPAGTFAGCMRIQRSRVRAAGDPVAEGDEDLFWFCPGVGKVREEDQTTGQTEELVACEVPGGACP